MELARAMRICNRAWKPWLAALWILAIGGCAQSAGTNGSPAPAPAPNSVAVPARHSETAAPSPPAAAAVEILNWEQTQKRREKLLGKVVVLDVWSTFCQPCVREFPNLVKLQERFGGEKVACISFNTDYTGAKDEPPESFRDKVLAFLTTQKAHFFNVLSRDPNEEFFDKIRLGGPPAVFVYDRQGKLVKRFDNSQVPKTPEFTYKADVVPLVERLLTETGRR
jgi:thiol-disulfide isomerase/thioredoxin